MPARKLNLRSELLTELTPTEMLTVAAGEGATAGSICTGIMVGTAITTLITATIVVVRTSEADPS